MNLGSDQLKIRLVAVSMALLAVGYVAFGGTMARADVLHKITVTPGGVVGGYGGSFSSGTPIHWTGSGSGSDGVGDSVNANWSLRSDRGSLHAKISKEAFGTRFPHADIAKATAELVIDDLVFSGSGGRVSPSLVLDLAGIYWTDTDAYGGVFVQVRLDGPGYSYSYSGAHSGFGTSGLLGGWSYPDGQVWWGIPSIELNVAHTLTLLLSAEATGGDNAFGDGYASSWSDFFGGGLSFAANGPVFANLPGGVSVDSAQGGIVDNRYLGPTIPEPSSLLACLAAMTLCGMGRWRRHD